MTRSRALLLSVLAIALLGGGVFVVGLRGSATTGAPGGAQASTSSAGTPDDSDGDAASAADVDRDARLAARPDGRAAGETRTQDGKGTTTPVRVTGRVVDDRRRPVPGARVSLHLLDASPSSGTSGADGRFEIEATLTRSRTYAIGSVRAVGGSRATLGGVNHWPPVADIGTLELAPAYPIFLRVVDEGAAVPGAHVQLWTIHSKAGLVRIGEDVTDGKGEVTIQDFPPGTILLLATGANGRRARATVRIADSAPEPLVIELRPERTLDVIVTDREGKGVQGAVLELMVARDEEGGIQQVVEYDPPPTIPLTDAAGLATIRGLCESEELELGARADGFAPSGVREAEIRDGRAVISLDRTRNVSWPLVAGERPTPASGTAVELRRWPGSSGSAVPPTARVEGSHLVVDGLSMTAVHAIATAPDGSIAELHLAKADGQPPDTSFVRPRRIDVAILDAAGRGVPGISLMPRCRMFSEESWPPGRRTDAQGAVIFQGLPPRDFRVIRYWSEWGSGASVGEVLRLADGDARVEVRVGDEQDLEVHFRVGGEARLPSAVTCRVADAKEIRSEEDPERGILRMRVRPWTPSAKGSLEAQGNGFEPKGVEFAWATDGPTVVPIDLERTGVIVAHVARKLGVEFEVNLELFLKEGEDVRGWVYWGSGPIGDPQGPSVRYTGLSPGEYRLHDMATGLVSETVSVREGGGSVDLSLDLTTTYEVSGRVVVPEGYESYDARVIAEGRNIDVSDADPEKGGKTVGRRADGENGAFRFLVPGGRPIVLRVTHPELLPDRERGAVTVESARDDLVLRLVEGPRATFHAVAPPGMPLTFESRFLDGTLGTALLLTGDAAPKPVLQRGLAGAPPNFRFAGYVPGTYSVFIDAAPFAPMTLRDVKLGEGRTDLGEIAFARGSTVTVRLRTSEGKPAPGASITAWQNAEPRYFRNQGTGLDSGRIRGLAAGHFTIQVEWTDATGRSRVVDSEVDVDGRSDLVLDVDVR